jgi:hypothetical protein
VPQVHILLFIWGSGYFYDAGSLDAQFGYTFSLSVVSASLGIAKFLKLGPCRLVPGDGPLGGYCQPSFLLLVVNNAVWLVGKGLFMAFGFTHWFNKAYYVIPPNYYFAHYYSATQLFRPVSFHPL